VEKEEKKGEGSWQATA